MNISKKQEGQRLEVILEGRLDTTTTPELENEIKDLSSVNDLVFDFSKLEYISSAGLRVLLATQKEMNKHGKMTIKNVNKDVMEVFSITGFVDILHIE